MRAINGGIFQTLAPYNIKFTYKLREKFSQTARVRQPREWTRDYSHCPGTNKASGNDSRELQVIVLMKEIMRNTDSGKFLTFSRFC